MSDELFIKEVQKSKQSVEMKQKQVSPKTESMGRIKTTVITQTNFLHIFYTIYTIFLLFFFNIIYYTFYFTATLHNVAVYFHINSINGG